MPTGRSCRCLEMRVRPAGRKPTSYNNKVAACARFTRFGERGTGAAPATSER